MPLNLPSLKQITTILNPSEQVDKTTFSAIKRDKLTAVLPPSETTYTNLINATMIEFVKQFKTIRYDSSDMIMSCGDQMLLIAVLEDYIHFQRPVEFRTFFSFATVVINTRPIMSEDCVTLDEFMDRVYQWVAKVLHVKC